MSPRRVARIAVVVVAATVAAVGCGGSPALVVSNVRVIDVERGVVSAPQTVMIVGERIAEIGAAADVRAPDDARRVDGGGRFLMPGLTDMHVHIFDGAGVVKGWMFPLLVDNGVTAVREMAARAEWMPEVRRWQAKARGGELVPDLVAVGVVVGGGKGDVAEQVASAAAAGADFVKIFSDVPVARWRVVLDEAKRRGLPVIGHVPAQVTLREAAQAGQRGDEHLMQAYEACTRTETGVLEARRGVEGDALAALLEAQEPVVLDSFDEEACAQAASAVAATGQLHTPTLVLPFVEEHFGPARFEDDARWARLSAKEQRRWRNILAGLTPQQRTTAARRWNVAQQIARVFIRAGVPILAGTDAPSPYLYPGASLHQELELLVASGMSTAAALRAATLTPARALGQAAHRGSVAVGKRADLLLLEANPLDDIRNTRRIFAVVLRGRWLPSSSSSR